MKLHVVRFKVIPIIFILLNSLSLCASSLVYKSSVVTQDKNYPFHSGDIVQGFVRLNDGFCVSPLATGIMDCYMSVSGGFSLNDTGTLRLLKNLEFDGAVTLTSHGYIDGRGKAFIFNDKVSLDTNKVLHISGDTIIDGRSNVLSVGSGAQIFVDTNVTLTLRNLTLCNGNRTPTFPPIRLASFGSKLALDNVIVAPTGDFNFPQGKFFIHNDVVFTGSSTFVYQSTQPSFITSHGHLIFDCGTSFSFCPSTTGDHLMPAMDLLHFQDQSSVLMMNGADLLVSLTNMRITKGTILFDNAVNVKTDYALQVDSNVTHSSFDPDAFSSISLSGMWYRVAWSPDGRIVAAGSYTSFDVQAYRFSADVAGGLTAIGSAAPLGTAALAVAWNPDGRHIAVGCVGSVRILQFTGTGLIAASSGETISGYVYAVAWSPDGNYVAAGADNGDIKIYQFTQAGSSWLLNVASDSFTNVTSVSWSPDGSHIVVGNTNGEIKVYIFTPGGGLVPVGSGLTTFGSNVKCVAWSPDGRSVAAGNSSGDVKIYRFTGGGSTGGLSDIGSGQMPFGSFINSLSWNFDGSLLEVSGGMVGVYSFLGSGNFGGLAGVGSKASVSSQIYSASWRPDGKYIVVGGIDFIKLYPLIYQYLQLSGQLVLGNAAFGSSFDCIARLLSGAQVNVAGHIEYDCVS